jgi:hypothetical protein
MEGTVCDGDGGGGEEGKGREVRIRASAGGYDITTYAKRRWMNTNNEMETLFPM